jgi:hypothetical protein
LSRIRSITSVTWSDVPQPSIASEATEAIERGDVLFFPDLQFAMDPRERDLFSPAILSSKKNISLDPASGILSGTSLEGRARERLRTLMGRFSDAAVSMASALFPSYRGRLERARASFRPAEIAGRSTTWRHDDTRLHIDSFPASPVQGRRILRIFANVNPSGLPRSWRVGGDFEPVARRFAPALEIPWRASRVALQLIRVTKGRRSVYDSLMLQLHDRMKSDAVFQRECEQESFDFPSGSTWAAFTDQVSHAAMAGQYQLEQTFLLPVDAMIDDRRSPLRILERIKGRALAS